MIESGATDEKPTLSCMDTTAEYGKKLSKLIFNFGINEAVNTQIINLIRKESESENIYHNVISGSKADSIYNSWKLNGDINKTDSDFKNLILEYPQEYYVKFAYLKFLHEIGKDIANSMEKNLQQLEKSTKENNAIYYLFLSKVYESKKNIGQSIKTIERGLNFDPKNLYLIKNLIYYLTRSSPLTEENVERIFSLVYENIKTSGIDKIQRWTNTDLLTSLLESHWRYQRNLRDEDKNRLPYLKDAVSSYQKFVRSVHTNNLVLRKTICKIYFSLGCYYQDAEINDELSIKYFNIAKQFVIDPEFNEKIDLRLELISNK